MEIMEIAELEKEFGCVQYEGRKYVLCQDAYIDGPVDGPWIYRADAICPDDDPDDDIHYEVTWEPKEEFYEYSRECSETGDWCDEGDACDWEHPYGVRKL